MATRAPPMDPRRDAAPLRPSARPAAPARPFASALLLALALAAACGPIGHLQPPDDFKRFVKDPELKYITADGVRLKVREVENYPRATLPFWADALKGHMLARGYAFKQKHCFETREQLAGCTLDFITPHGSEDWVLSVTLFVSGDRVVLLEAAGPFDRFAALEKRLRESFKTLSLGD